MAHKQLWEQGLRDPSRLSWYYDPADPSNNTLFALVLERHTWEWWAASMMVLISLIPNC